MFTKVKDKISGKKTYIALGIYIVMVLANKFLGIEIPGFQLNPNDWIADLLVASAGIFGRQAITKIGK